MRLKDTILAGHGSAYIQLSDLIRSHQGTHRDFMDRVKKIHADAGLAEPSDACIDAIVYEAEVSS